MQNNKKAKISIIIPTYNENDNIKLLLEELNPVLIDYNYEIIFIDDGSTDNSLDLIKLYQNINDKLFHISFSRNFGHQAAIKAGLDHAKGDCVISMDADLQHPPALIPSLIDKWNQGYKIVSTKRLETEDASAFKKLSSKLFYKIINLISNINLSEGSADFRLIDKDVARILKEFNNENNLFWRGIIAWIGFKQCCIEYTSCKRFHGKSKYSFRKMVDLSINGIMSFSIAPLRFAITLGLIICILNAVYLVYIICNYLNTGTVRGWASTISCVLLMGGVQLTMLGVMGEYLGKLFINSKRRPVYIIQEKKLP